MGFKVIGVTAGRNDSRCGILLKEALQVCQKNGAEITMINLSDNELLECTGCRSCATGRSAGRHKGCSLDNDRFLNILSDQDAFIFAAPDYALMPSSLFLKFIHQNLNSNSESVPKVGALIAVEDSPFLPDPMMLERMRELIFPKSIRIADVFTDDMYSAPAQVLVHEARLSRARQTGANVMQALKVSQVEHKRIGEMMSLDLNKQCIKPA